MCRHVRNAAERRQESESATGPSPGSRHDRIVKAGPNTALPEVIVGILIAVMLAIAPFEQRGDVSFILDKNKVAKRAPSGCESSGALCRRGQ